MNTLTSKTWYADELFATLDATTKSTHLGAPTGNLDRYR